MSYVFALYFSVQSDQRHYYVGAQYSIDNKGIPVYDIFYMNNRITPIIHIDICNIPV